MDAIKPATPEEIQRISASADITGASTVLSMGENLAVLRQCLELDPVYFADASPTSQRMLFIWGIENILRIQGAREYYFEVPQDNDTWKNAVEKWGATHVFNGQPMYRYKKVLF